MTREVLIEEIRNMIKEWKITPENKEWFRAQAIAVLGEKYSYREEYDEGLFGKIVDEIIEEKLSKTEKNISMEDVVKNGLKGAREEEIASAGKIADKESER